MSHNNETSHQLARRVSAHYWQQQCLRNAASVRKQKTLSGVARIFFCDPGCCHRNRSQLGELSNLEGPKIHYLKRVSLTDSLNHVKHEFTLQSLVANFSTHLLSFFLTEREIPQPLSDRHQLPFARALTLLPKITFPPHLEVSGSRHKVDKGEL